MTPTISIYHNSVPEFIEDELSALYTHINSSLHYLKIRFKKENISTYICRNQNTPTAILLFKKIPKKIIVLNEMIKIEEEELFRFSNYIFFNMADIDIISFSLMQKYPYRLPLPTQQFDVSEDFVVTLPTTAANYLQGLSAKTRRNIRHQLKTLKQDFPDFQYNIYQCSEISEKHIDELIALNKDRIAGKHIRYGVSEEEKRNIKALAERHGLVLVATIDGKTCGGAINLRVGDSYFGHTIAHDSRFDAYGLGMLCAYLMICENIRRGGKKAHLSWGRYAYKYRLSAVLIEMARLSVYRSRKAYFLDAFSLCRNGLMTLSKRWKISLLAKEQKKGIVDRYLAKIIDQVRKIKRSLPPHS
jgi:hypothetical protein